MIRKNSLGKGGPSVSRLGFGAGALEGVYGPIDDQEAERAIHRAIDEGMTLFDTSTIYGDGNNERRIGKAIKGRRSEVFIGTKFGVVSDPNEASTLVPVQWQIPIPVNGTPAFIERALHGSLERLGVETIDLWILHYPDPSTSIEDTVGAMARAVKSGKVRHLGLSNVTAEQVRRAHAVHTIATVQYEYSLWRREPETTLLPTLRELGIALEAWSPLGQGFFAGPQPIGEADFRQVNPRFTGDNFKTNQQRFAPLVQLATELNITPAQLALAWLLSKGDDVFAIPGSNRVDYVVQNAKADQITLDAATLRRIDELAPPGLAVGAALL